MFCSSTAFDYALFDTGVAWARLNLSRTSGRRGLFLRTFAPTREDDRGYGKKRKTSKPGKAGRFEKVDARRQNFVKRLSPEVDMTDGHPLRHNDARSPGNSRNLTA